MEDPRVSREASAEGNSAERADGTSVLCAATLHKMPNQPQNSLQATRRRLPIEDEPCTCEQEAVESVVMAGRMNRMVEMAKPNESDADVDGKATLGRELAGMVHRVDEGGEEREPQAQLQQMKFYCEESCQCSRNATENIPSAHGLPLEGEWAVYLSGEMKNSNGNAGREVKPADSSNESETLVTLSIESEDPRIHLGGTSCHAGDANHLGNRTDRSEGQADGSRALMDELRGRADVPSQSNNAETNVTDHGESVSTYLGIGDAKRVIHETYGVGSHADVSPGQTDASSVETDANRSANATKKVRTARKKVKPPDIPVEAASCAPGESNGLGDATVTSSMPTDMYSVADEAETTENETGNVRTRQTGQKMQNSPIGAQIETAKPTGRWKRVSVDDVDVYLPWGAPVEMPSRTFAFGWLESGETAIAPDIEGERARNSDDDRDGDVGGVDGTTSGSSVDSIQVNEALLAVESQHVRQTRRPQSNDLPVLSGPPTKRSERPYGLVTWRRRRGRIKIASINVSQPQEVEMTHLERTHAAQPPQTDSKRSYRVIGPRRRRDRTKIKPKKLKIERMSVSQTQQGETTYCGRTQTAQPPGYHSKHCREVYQPRH